MRHIEKIALWVKTFFPQIHLEICIGVSFPKTSLLKNSIHEQNHRYRNHRFEGPYFRHPSGIRSVSQKAELFMCVNQNQHRWLTFGAFCEFQRRGRQRLACLWSPWPFETDPWEGPGGIYRGPDFILSPSHWPSPTSLVGGWGGQDGHWINPQCSLGPLGQDWK